MQREAAAAVAARPWEAGARAAWANRWPGAALSALAVGILLAYLLLPGVRAAIEQVSRFKQDAGWWFPMLTTAAAGGLTPWLVQRLRPTQRAKATWAVGLFVVLFWAYKGVETEWFYRARRCCGARRPRPA